MIGRTQDMTRSRCTPHGMPRRTSTTFSPLASADVDNSAERDLPLNGLAQGPEFLRVELENRFYTRGLASCCASPTQTFVGNA
jgi:hypothetical protein